MPYAYGAAYVHPLEHLFLDNMSVFMGALAGMLSIRQGMIFFSLATLKDMYDHCGYSLPLPWYPVLCDVRYHDIHHQPWGIKYSGFWDYVCGTYWMDQAAASANYGRNCEWADAQIERFGEEKAAVLAQQARRRRNVDEVPTKPDRLVD